ncbi:MAG: ferrochelatase [Nitrospirae bacterium]|nr:ferrochelatase [Nitrospirota bacterium]
MIGILLLNLGGPDSLQAVRPFLYNLFSDREIIKLGPSFLQKPLAWLVSFLRSKKTEKMYSLIGGKSPILNITMAQADALEKALNSSLVTEPALSLSKGHSSLSFKVYIGMRYWHPLIEDTVETISEDGVKKLIVLSLYPHYSKATTGSAFMECRRALNGKPIEAMYIEHWYNFPPYIDALIEVIENGLAEFKEREVSVLFSAHSLPEDFIIHGDPYVEHIKATIKEINKRLSLKWYLSFQSRSGPVRWLRPTTEEVIIELADTNCRNLLIVPISFVSDHIETLYEIDVLYRGLAMKHGIELKRVQSFNDSERFINVLKELVIGKVKEAGRRLDSTRWQRR